MNHAVAVPAIVPESRHIASFLVASRRYLLSATLAAGLGIGSALAEPEKDTSAAETQIAVEKTKKVMADSWITTQIKSQILADGVSRGFQVGVDTVDGAVVLKGSLGSREAIEHVKSLAEKVKGVNSVDIAGVKVSSQQMQYPSAKQE